MTRTVALIVAAGSGRRFGDPTPKQYHLLADKPLLRHCLEAFLRHPRIDAVQVVIDPAHRALYDASCAGLDLPEPVAGGATRQQSVRRGLDALAVDPPERVLIHDAARPGVDARIIDGVLDTLTRAPAALPALAVTDTLKRADATGRVVGTVERDRLYRAQTPQGFAFAAIHAAHQRFADAALTDDIALAEAAGLAALITPGAADNDKITYAADLVRPTAIEHRTGSGFDVHRFDPDGDHCMLCGVAVPHSAGLAGHSDADVGLHALTDALLATIAAGDIGDHFPPDDPAWRGAASDRFLAHAAGLVDQAGGRTLHVDVTLICERPRIGPYRAAMRARLAEILGLEIERVSVKATTTEGLGFTGRGEGIAAQAVATVGLTLPSRRRSS